MAQLRTELYGYALRKALADHGLAIDENTLYPLLRRLETQGLLVSHWREEEKRNKRFYRLSPQGEIILYQLLNEHEAMNAAIDRIMAPSPPPQTVSTTGAGNGHLRKKGTTAMTKPSTDLIDRYLQAVGFWLPRDQKQDILAEISEDLRSQLEDREERTRTYA